MSPRGWRFATRHGDDLVYVEADLPAMAARKRDALARMGSLTDRHRVADLDVLRDGGPGSFSELIAGLDPTAGTAIITEGLTSYLSDEQVDAVWRRFADSLHGFPAGLYLSDLRLAGEGRDPVEQVFNAGLGAFVRGKIYPHFASEAAAAAALVGAGFDEALLHRGDLHPAAELSGDAGAALIHVIEGRIGAAGIGLEGDRSAIACPDIRATSSRRRLQGGARYEEAHGNRDRPRGDARVRGIGGGEGRSPRDGRDLRLRTKSARPRESSGARSSPHAPPARTRGNSSSWSAE